MPRVCKYWSETGSCEFGDGCKFAHGAGGGSGMSASAAQWTPGVSPVAVSAAAPSWEPPQAWEPTPAPAPQPQPQQPQQQFPSWEPASASTPVTDSAAFDFPAPDAGAGGLTASAPAFVPAGAAAADAAAAAAAAEAEVMAAAQQQQQAEAAAAASTQPVRARRTLESLALPDHLARHYQAQHLLAAQHVDPADPLLKQIPGGYHLVTPLEHVQNTSGSMGFHTSTFKVVSKSDGTVSVLRRVDGVRAQPSFVEAAMEQWQRVRHPNIVPLRVIFAQRGAVFFAHEFFAGAETLAAAYLTAGRGPPVEERLMWTLLCQLVPAVAAVHRAGAAVRCISTTGIVVSAVPSVRFRISKAGVLDVLEESPRSLAELQRQDLAQLALVVLSLACRAHASADDAANVLGAMAQSYSAELIKVVTRLLVPQTSVFDVVQLMAGRLMAELDAQTAVADALDAHLSTEFHNGRLLRLMLKLGIVNERPGLAGDSNWAETGDRYVLKLFRDFVFHQVGPQGEPVLDMGHIVSSLNKVDVGDPERVLLCSRDQQSLLAVSFADVRHCAEAAFQELCMHSHAARQG